MVPDLIILLAHGADPTPISWDEALANLVKFGVTFLLVAAMSYPILAPLLSSHEDPMEQGEGTRNEVVGWVAVAALLVLAMGWWLARTSVVEVMTEEQTAREDHSHTQTEGGQVAMWADFHAEVVRVESGEVRIFLRDSYDRDIAARYFQAEVQALDIEDEPGEGPVEAGSAVPTEAALNDAYRFARLPREWNNYRVKVSTPGWSTTLRFDFDGSRGRRSLPIWCAPPGR